MPKNGSTVSEFDELPSLKLTVRPLKIGHPKRKESSSNHPFSGAKMLVSGDGTTVDG